MAPRLERTVISVGAGLTPTCVYDRSPGGAGTPVATGSAGPMSPKPSTVRTADGSVVDAFTSRRARFTRQIAATPLSASVGVAFLTTVTFTVAEEVPHVAGSENTEQFVTSSRNVSTVPSGMFGPLTNLLIANVMRGRSCVVPNGVAPMGSAIRCAVSLAASGFKSAPTCPHVYESGIFAGVVVSRLPEPSSVTTSPRFADWFGPASAIGVKTADPPSAEHAGEIGFTAPGHGSSWPSRPSGVSPATAP